MIITKIEPFEKKKGFSNIFADNEYLMTVSNEIISDMKLSVNKSLDFERLKELNNAVLIRRAKERLLYALDRRLHSEKELREKLKKDYPQNVIDSAIERLKELGLIDDRAFAERFSEYRFEVQKKGEYAIRQELILKGVSRDIIDEVLSALFEDEDLQFQGAMRVLEKYKNQLDTPSGKRRALSALSRKGYSYSVSKKAIERLVGFFED